MAANPAAVYCLEKYGNLEIVKSKLGEYGVVRLPDGKLYDEWYVYYKETKPQYFEKWVKGQGSISAFLGLEE